MSTRIKLLIAFAIAVLSVLSASVGTTFACSKLFYLQRDRVKAGRMLVTEWEVVINLETVSCPSLATRFG
jgi:hypothetical protein